MHTIKILFVFLFVFPFFAQAQNTLLTPQEASIFKSKVREQTNFVKTISGDFIQKKHLTFLVNEVESRGEFYFSKPGKIKWAYSSPYQYAVIFRENKLLINDEGKKSSINIGNNEIMGKLNALIVNSISGKMLESPDFKASFEQNKVNYFANLTPTDPVVLNLFTKIILSFNKENFSIEKVKLVEPSGDYTQIYFTKLKINAPINDSVFEF